LVLEPADFGVLRFEHGNQDANHLREGRQPYPGISSRTPRAISLGNTVEEARRNLDEAIEMVLEGNRLVASNRM
jgi:hypothetical protein